MSGLLCLPLTATDEEIFAAVEVLIEDLARGDFESAFQRTLHDPYQGWSPRLLEQVIAGYGLPTTHPSGQVFTVTPLSLAPGNPFHSNRRTNSRTRR